MMLPQHHLYRRLKLIMPQHDMFRIVILMLILVLAVQQLPTVHSGYVDYELLLEPTASFVHYNDGYIRGPGFIDLGSLSFTPLSDIIDTKTDDSINDDGGGNNRHRRQLNEATRIHRINYSQNHNRKNIAALPNSRPSSSASTGSR